MNPNHPVLAEKYTCVKLPDAVAGLAKVLLAKGFHAKPLQNPLVPLGH